MQAYDAGTGVALIGLETAADEDVATAVGRGDDRVYKAVEAVAAE